MKNWLVESREKLENKIEQVGKTHTEKMAEKFGGTVKQERERKIMEKLRQSEKQKERESKVRKRVAELESERKADREMSSIIVEKKREREVTDRRRLEYEGGGAKKERKVSISTSLH